MTRAQFALAVNADEKWVENSARLLGRTVSFTPSEARWMGLVRVLVKDIGIPLARAAAISDEAMELPPDSRSVELSKNKSGSARIVLDLARYHSSHSAALSAALILGAPRKRRGRPPRSSPISVAPGSAAADAEPGAIEPSAQRRIEASGAAFGWMLGRLVRAEVRFVVSGAVAAGAHGLPGVPESLGICYEASRPNVSRLVKLLKKWDAHPRGVEQDLPFFMSKRQFRATPVMALETRKGAIDVFDRIEGVGDHDECRGRSISIHAFDVELRILDRDALTKPAARP